MVSYKSKYLFLLLIILISSFFLKLNYVKKYATYTDEILSSISANAIVHTGTPRLPSGGLYHRNLLYHYILAIPLGLFGFSYWSMRIASILFSLLTIWVIYLLGVRITNRRVALAAAFLLSFSSPVNQFALSGRMYMAFTFFFTLTFYLFYRGFIEKHSFSRKLCIISMAASMLTSEAGLITWPILLFLLYIYHKLRYIRDPMVILGCMIWVLLASFYLFYRIPGSFEPFTVHSGMVPSRLISLQFPIREVIRILTNPWRKLDAYLPFSIPFFLAMTIFLAKKRDLKRHFPLLALFPILIILCFFNLREQNRVVISLMPLYLLASCQLFSSLIQWIILRQQRRKFQNQFLYSRSKLLLTTTVVLILLLAGIISYKHIPVFSRHLSSYIIAFGYNDSKSNPQPTYDSIKKHANKNDIIIQTTLEYGFFFLGTSQEYYYLRQKIKLDEMGNPSYTTFEKGKDPYYGRPIIDSKSKLIKLLQSSNKKIWIVLGPKSKWSVGPELKKFIESNFNLVFDDLKRNGTRLYYYKVSSS